MKSFGRKELAPPALTAVAESAGLSAPASTQLAELQQRRRDERLSALRRRVLDQVDTSQAADMSPAQLQQQLGSIIHSIAESERWELSAIEESDLADELTNDMVGFGPLQQLLADDQVTDIMVNGAFSVYVEKLGKLVRTNVRFRDNEHVASVARKIASSVGRRIDESSPMVDARLRDGGRINVVFPPIAIDGPSISIRKFARKRPDFGQMTANGTMVPGVATLLEIAAKCRLNILIAGGTGSGKTTLLNAMSRMIDNDERIVTIEDAAELQLQQPHVVRLETRPPNLEGTGEIKQRELLRNALRMRPDRIILGEVRGPEAFDMLQAMNTGHDGSFCTIHANNTRDALTRVENLVQMGNFGLPVRGIRAQIANAIDLVVHLERMRDGVRRVTQISDVCGLEGDVVTMNDVVTFNFDGEDPQGRIHGHYRRLVSRPSFRRNLEYFALERAWMEALESI
jgi:pilus assembly protein CpaF